MSRVDELHDKKMGIKEEIRAKQSELNEAVAEFNAAVGQEYIDEATKQVKLAAEREGRTPEEQANYWLSIQWADPGKHIMAQRFLQQKLVNARDLGLV